MDTTVKEIFSIINDIAPFTLAEEWDNCGLQVGNFSWCVKKILVALDISMDVMNHAAASRSDLVVSHHPLMLYPPKSIDFSKMPGSAIAIAALHKISVISAHTNLDKVDGGLNDYFANIIGLKNLRIFISSNHSSEHLDKSTNRDNLNGIGRTGELEQPLSLQEFALYIKKRLKLETIRMTGNHNLSIKKVALCTGSGGSLLKDFFKSGADVYVTGDVKYHEARQIEEAGLGLIDVGHFASERIAVELLCKKLGKIFIENSMNIEIEGFYADSDPFITLYNI
ncbi:MAG: Nif3-like dinuclear metal center hexameric protein [Desulfamplus sp.]|nr:Nif3-like dinuclear metal center hexameric protein [Desulfamplus sp.]MBF0413958.1 Nif3-like dinuclear metal center hexameric protein [Desulfamplus sp.]